MFRKTVVTTAIIGAGLGAMSGAAFAGDDPCDGGHSSSSDSGSGHHSHHGSKAHDASATDCSNGVSTKNVTDIGGASLANVVAPVTANAPINACHILDGNSVLDHNQVNLLTSLR
jgi:hypothetical protein